MASRVSVRLVVPAYFHPAVAPGDWAALAALAGRVRLAARRGLHRVVLNPGVPTHPLYRDLGVRICTFEGPWSAYRTLQVPAWARSGPRERFLHLVHSVPVRSLPAARRLVASRHAGAAYVTDLPGRAGENPYQRLPVGTAP